MQNSLNIPETFLTETVERRAGSDAASHHGENSKRKFNCCQTSMTSRVGIHPRVIWSARMRMLVPLPPAGCTFLFFPFVPADQVFSAPIHLLRR